MKPKTAVLTGYGINCEEETKFAFEACGSKADIIHINDLIDKKYSLNNFQIIAIPGGFAYGDDTGSGNAYANRLKNHLWQKLMNFIQKDRLVIGICNGFQILVNLGLLPAIWRNYGQRQVALINNDNARYTNRWVDVKVENQNPWLMGIKTLTLPIAHGEGKFFADNKTLTLLNKKNLVALRYFKGEISSFFNLPFNPNGALDDIAGVTDETGKIFGLMPHPERAQFFEQLPNWTLLAEKYKRIRKERPKEGPGLAIFKNAVRYFAE